MKTVKIILGIIIGLSLVFFATGLIVKETNYSVSTTIDKPIAEVFSEFENMDMLKEWIPEIKSITTIEEKPAKVGSSYTIVIENQGQEVTMKEEILAYTANEKISFSFTTGQMLKTDAYTFTSKNGKTLLTQNTTIQAKSYILACTFPWFKGNFIGISQGYLDKFKTVVER